MKPFSLFEICKAFDLVCEGQDVTIKELNLSNRCVETDSVLTYCASKKYIPKENQVAPFKAFFATETVGAKIKESYPGLAVIITSHPEATFYKVFKYLVANSYYVNDNNTSNMALINAGNGTIIEPGAVIGDNVTIGCNSVIKSNAIIGNDVVIGSNTVIGEDDLQAIKDEDGNFMIIPHVGGVKIGNGVRIGSCCTVSRSLFSGHTEIGDHTLIGDFSHVAHNCLVGKNVTMTLGVILSGSSVVEDNAWLGPNSTVNNKIVVGNGGKVGISSLAVRNVPAETTIFGVPGTEL